MSHVDPLVSVIIPTYNSGEFICTAVDSVLGQTFKDTEIIVIDDGSTDDTQQHLEKYEGQIRYQYQSNQERSVARNQGIHLARGRFIAFLDADDWWLPNKLERQISHMERCCNLGVVYSLVNVVNETGECLRLLGNERPLNEDARTNLLEWFLLGNSIPTPSVIVRRECIQAIGGFDESITYIEDWDLWMRLASRYSIGYVAEPLACYRVRHTYLPAVFARHQLQTMRIRTIEKALATRPDVDSDVRVHALLKAYWYSALIDFGIKDVSAAHGWIEQVLAHTSEFVGWADELETGLIAFAFSLYGDFTPEAEATAFMEFVLENLPLELRPLKKRRRQILGVLISGYAFQARARGDSDRAKTLMRRALVMSPSLALNIGALTTGLTGDWLDNIRKPNATR